MCADCKDMVALIEKTRDIRGSRVEYTITIPGNNRAKLIGPDNKEIHPSGTEQLPFTGDS